MLLRQKASMTNQPRDELSHSGETDPDQMQEQIDRLTARNRQLEQQLEIITLKLEQLDAVKRDFITIASHELRTPLTQIQGYSDLLTEMIERGDNDVDTFRHMLTRLRFASARMAEVITTLVNVAEIDVEGLALDLQPVSIASLIEAVAASFKDAFKQRAQNLLLSKFDTLPHIEADPGRLKLAFQHLISNAIKFTPDGGIIRISADILGYDEDNNPSIVHLIFSDTGIGIDPDSQQLIFEKFYRDSPVELHSTSNLAFKGAGPGLGLPITRGIIEAHGGRIWVESPGYDEDKMPGSQFHVALRIKPPTTPLRKLVDENSDNTVIEKLDFHV
jgi:signal transduction histidine kinase